ncbi:MAG TPA: DegV family protein [Feifaniaceae bacterium]|nr:DegV family protein [Feifaniaceae bacterium]
MATAITADSTCDISPALYKRYDIAMVSLYITLGDQTYRDGLDITPNELFQYVERTGELPKTAAPSPEDYRAAFKRLADEGKGVVHISISSEMSASYANACRAAKEFENVYVIDSRSLSTGSGLLVVKAAELAALGLDAKEVSSRIASLVPQVEASFVVDTLTYLHKGGRCSSVAALGANLLHLKPCIEVREGRMQVSKKYRGTLKRCLSDYVKDRLVDRADIDPSRAFITHTVQDAALLEHTRKAVLDAFPFAEVIITDAGGTISSHCGPGTLGVLFLRKEA